MYKDRLSFEAETEAKYSAKTIFSHVSTTPLIRTYLDTRHAHVNK